MKDKNINWYEALFYGSTNLRSYDSGMDIKAILLENHYKIYGDGFGDIDLDGNFKKRIY